MVGSRCSKMAPASTSVAAKSARLTGRTATSRDLSGCIVDSPRSALRLHEKRRHLATGVSLPRPSPPPPPHLTRPGRSLCSDSPCDRLLLRRVCRKLPRPGHGREEFRPVCFYGNARKCYAAFPSLLGDDTGQSIYDRHEAPRKASQLSSRLPRAISSFCSLYVYNRENGRTSIQSRASHDLLRPPNSNTQRTDSETYGEGTVLLQQHVLSVFTAETVQKQSVLLHEVLHSPDSTDTRHWTLTCTVHLPQGKFGRSPPTYSSRVVSGHRLFSFPHRGALATLFKSNHLSTCMYTRWRAEARKSIAFT